MEQEGGGEVILAVAALFFCLRAVSSSDVFRALVCIHDQWIEMSGLVRGAGSYCGVGGQL